MLSSHPHKLPTLAEANGVETTLKLWGRPQLLTDSCCLLIHIPKIGGPHILCLRATGGNA
jgi:hypothetical protein